MAHYYTVDEDELLCADTGKPFSEDGECCYDEDAERAFEALATIIDAQDEEV